MQFVPSESFIERLKTELNDETIEELSTCEKVELYNFAKAIIEACPQVNSLESFSSLYRLDICFKENKHVLNMLKYGTEFIKYCYLVIDSEEEEIVYFKNRVEFAYQRFQNLCKNSRAPL